MPGSPQSNAPPWNDSDSFRETTLHLFDDPAEVHLYGDDGPEFMVVFTHGKLEALEPIVGKASDACRSLGRGLLWTRDSIDRGELVPAAFFPFPVTPPPQERALLVVQLLCEGCSILSIERITGTEKRTIIRLLVEVGGGWERLLTELVKGVAVEEVQADEVWGYLHCKEGTKERRGISDQEAGDAYCFIGP